MLVPPVVSLLLSDRFAAALVVFGVAGVSDGIDGYLAKRFHWTTHIGALLDPLADKLLLVCSFVTLGYLGWIPYWLVGLVILRDLVIVAGAVSYHYFIEQLVAEPSHASKLNTFAQILLVLTVMFTHGIHALPAVWIDILLYTVMVTTVWSGVGYVWTWSRRALQRRAS